jgi:hypothetical protein
MAAYHCKVNQCFALQQGDGADIRKYFHDIYAVTEIHYEKTRFDNRARTASSAHPWALPIIRLASCPLAAAAPKG